MPIGIVCSVLDVVPGTATAVLVAATEAVIASVKYTFVFRNSHYRLLVIHGMEAWTEIMGSAKCFHHINKVIKGCFYRAYAYHATCCNIACRNRVKISYNFQARAFIL